VTASFEIYGLGHISALALICFIAGGLILICRKAQATQKQKSVVSVCKTVSISLLVFACFAAYPLNQLAWRTVGGPYTLDATYPFHLCDIAGFICGFALITRKNLLCELAYFWGLAGTLQGLLTPNLQYDFPEAPFLSFFLLHGAIVITGLVLPLGLGWRPSSGAALRAFKWLLIYAVAVTGANIILKTNFGYLMNKPAEASLLDVMGPWPWYILGYMALAGFLLFLLQLPFKIKSRNAV